MAKSQLLPSDERFAITLTTFTFTSPRREINFRQFQLRQDIQLARYMLLVLCIVQPLFLLSDHLVVKPEYWPGSIVTLRLAFSMLCIWMLLCLGFFKRFQYFQLLVNVFSVVFFAFLLAEQLYFRENYALYALFDVLVLVCFYALGIMPLRIQAAIAVTYSVLALVMAFAKHFDAHTLAMLANAYLASNLVGIGLSAGRQYGLRVDYGLQRQLRYQSAKLHSMAFRDALTQAYNRRAFDDHFADYQRGVSRSQKSPPGTERVGVWIAVADIDHFKKVNDTYGHDVGDQVIVAFSKLLSAAVRSVDNVYRFGGEEFVVVLVSCSESIARARLESILQSLNGSGLGVPALKAPVTASFGLTCLQAGETGEQAIKRADTGLYQAKQRGRNRIVMVDAPMPQWRGETDSL